MITYSLLNLLLLTVLATTYIFKKPSISKTALCVSLLVIVALTAFFDPLMIALGLFYYDTDKTLGLQWFGAPIEDFAYALFAVPFVAALWHTIGERND